MKRYFVIVLAWIASLLAVGAWQRHDGAFAERSKWQTKLTIELGRANAKIIELTANYRQAEAKHANALASIATTYETRLSDAKAVHDRDVAAVRAGALRLRDPFAKCPLGSAAAPAGAGSSLGDGPAGAELSGAVTEFLLGEASRANAIVEQLTTCQQVVIEDRKLCGGGQ